MKVVRETPDGGGERDAELERHLAAALDADPAEIVIFVGGRRAGRAVERFARQVPARLRDRDEAQIAAAVDLYADQDPAAPVEARINQANAEFRLRFFAEIPCLTSAEVHRAAGRGGANEAQTASAWKRQGRIFACARNGRDLFPSFQFGEDGQPRPAVRALLDALPPAFTPWQRAAWFVARNAALEGATPAERIAAGAEIEPLRAAASQAGAVQEG